MKTDFQNIDKGRTYIGYQEACNIIEAHLHPILGMPCRILIVVDSEDAICMELQKRLPTRDFARFRPYYRLMGKKVVY